jgi:hypothetical protein
MVSRRIEEVALSNLEKLVPSLSRADCRTALSNLTAIYSRAESAAETIAHEKDLMKRLYPGRIRLTMMIADKIRGGALYSATYRKFEGQQRSLEQKRSHLLKALESQAGASEKHKS